MSAVKIGFVGVGSMGQCAHLKNYVTVPDCEVVAIAELRQGLAQKVAARYGVPKVYRNHEEMLAAEKLDGIVSAQPFTRHGTLMPELLKAGVPIFTEKPLAGSIEAGQKILDALQGSKAWHMVGYHKRSDPATMYAKAEIERLKQTGELGKLRYVRILMPAGDWVACGFCDLIRTDEPTPQLTVRSARQRHGRGNLQAVHQLCELLHPPGQPDASPAGRALPRDLCRPVRRLAGRPE